ncbi:MAG: ATP-binding cassette domain-containing protein, partial [Myxococcales bacterium]
MGERGAGGGDARDGAGRRRVGAARVRAGRRVHGGVRDFGTGRVRVRPRRGASRTDGGRPEALAPREGGGSGCRAESRHRGPALIEIADLSVAYGPVEALPPFSLSVAPGETVVLTGLSGCGKSTVLRALCGLLPEEATVRGTCRVDRLDTLSKPAELPRHVAYVPQNPAHALFCTTVREEVEAGPLHLGLDD